MLLCYNRNELDNSLDSIKSEKILEIEDLLCNQSKKIFIFYLNYLQKIIKIAMKIMKIFLIKNF